jgi:hypothetical protein
MRRWCSGSVRKWNRDHRALPQTLARTFKGLAGTAWTPSSRNASRRQPQRNSGATATAPGLAARASPSRPISPISPDRSKARRGLRDNDGRLSPLASPTGM